MLQLVDRWFVPLAAPQNYQRIHYVLLAVIIGVGTWLRFWNLGNVGLYGDEDIMALAARGIVATGVPELPSGMLYLRAPAHLYLLASSTILFGDNEWALRLPSALVGSLCGLFAFQMGRRFLSPNQNLAFVVLVTFLPALVSISLSARMYIFFVASLLVFGVALFRWEREGTTTAMITSLFVMLVAIQFHQLAIFAAPMLLYPGLANRSRKQLIQGVFAVGLAVVFSEWFGDFAHQDYPDESERLSLETEDLQSAPNMFEQVRPAALVAFATVVAGATFLLATVRNSSWRSYWPAVALLTVGGFAAGAMQYHAGLIALCVGAIFWKRSVESGGSRLLLIVTTIALGAFIQLWFLYDLGVFSGRKLLGAFVGIPSVWPTLRFLLFSPVAAAIVAIAVGLAAYRFSRNQRLPLYFLFSLFGVWGPLFAIGLFTWYAANRYTLGPLPFFLLLTIASLVYLAHTTHWGRIIERRPIVKGCVAIGMTVALLSPAALWRTAKNDYSDHPDHKGAAQFVKNLRSSSADIVIAEDSIVQTYYLGRVDYRLQNVMTAKSHSILRNGKLVGQYTGTPVIGSGAELRSVIDESSSKNVYIVSSAQASPGLELRNRANGISDVLASKRLYVVYLGRDRKTKVWKVHKDMN